VRKDIQNIFYRPAYKLFLLKQILAGAFITITMTGMDGNDAKDYFR
jgi:hypothetical protein